jgi:tetratricopeptide (TPR) repeat protein
MPLFILWLLWLATALLASLALHAFFIERLQGLRMSVPRLAVSGAVLAISTLIAAGLTFLPPQQIGGRSNPAASPLGSPAVLDRGKQQELDVISNQLAQLEPKLTELLATQEDLKQKEFELRNGGSLVPVAKHQGPDLFHRIIQETDRRNLFLGAAGTLTILLLASFLTLLLAGNTELLLPTRWLSGRRSRERLEAEKVLASLTAAVWDKDYRRGFEISTSISETKLSQFERLDFLFLRAYCIVQRMSEPAAPTIEKPDPKMLNEAILNLETVVESAPRRGEVVYLLGLAYGMEGRHADSLTQWERARELLKGQTLSFDQNESVCLLCLAEESLSQGNSAEAEAYFDRVARLGKLSGGVVHSRLRIAMIDFRNALNKNEIPAAVASLNKLRALQGPSKEEQAQINVITAAFDARIALRDKHPSKALSVAEDFLSKHLPSGLPAATENTADEVFSPVVDSDLTLPRTVFRGFLFISAVARCRLETQDDTRLNEAQVANLSVPLLRALQIDPRQRDLLGALGGLYYWFRRDQRAKALEWLEAATTMGVSGHWVRHILEHDRAVEGERRKALDWFRSASGRFLRDPSLAREVRDALVEELSRFQEFEPMLIQLRENPEFEPSEPTLHIIRERGKYLAQLIAEIMRSGQAERGARLAKIQVEYSNCLAILEQAAANINDLDKRVFRELGDSLNL